MDWISYWSVALAGLLLYAAWVGEGFRKGIERTIAVMIFLPPLGRVWGWW